ncbi:MAG: DNA replication and repair protein RecF, partial [Thermomicrobiaceae bacterium]|nr:DNA replication and repair protein RecF [Thermomicrobiaceae bacterium]
MRLTTLSLEEFRGFRRVRLAIPAAGLRVSGRNGSGKTSLLEAVYLIATMRSPRAASERELINWRSGEEYGVPPYSRVRASVALDDDQVDVEVALGIDEARGGAARKRVKLDGVPRRAIDAVGVLKVVLFAPEDLNLVLGPPSVRRRYLDVSLAQVDRAYLHSLSLYARIVQQRNSLLKELGARGVRDERRIDEELAYWDEELVLHGSYLVTARLRYLAGLAEAAREAFDRLASDDLPLDLRYLPTVALPEAQVARAIEASVADAQALVSRAYEAELARARPDELRRGVT